jgi:hypothetical protein
MTATFPAGYFFGLISTGEGSLRGKIYSIGDKLLIGEGYFRYYFAYLFEDLFYFISSFFAFELISSIIASLSFLIGLLAILLALVLADFYSLGLISRTSVA